MSNLVYVTTPYGKRLHGRIEIMTRTNDDLETVTCPVFIRDVDPEKDKMHIFNAWSIHPEAIEICKKENVFGILYKELGKPENPTIYSLRFDTFLKMLSGEIRDHKKRKLAWTASFKGGETVYIKLSAFNDCYLNQIEYAEKSKSIEDIIIDTNKSISKFIPRFGDKASISMLEHIKQFRYEAAKQKPSKKNIERLSKRIISIINNH